jgi:hypothetical protein
MTGRRVYVYRLEITYPEGSSEPGWRPALWSDPEFLRLFSRRTRRWYRTREFRWPHEHLYLSASGAGSRAALLRSWGAEVEVVRSLPVEFPVGTGEPVNWDAVMRDALGEMPDEYVYSWEGAQSCAADIEFDRHGLPASPGPYCADPEPEDENPDTEVPDTEVPDGWVYLALGADGCARAVRLS